jgi:hypothetical protein
MKLPGILPGVIFAALVGIAAGITGTITSGLISPTSLFALIVNLTTLAYLIVLLKHSNARVGKVVVFCSWAIVAVASWSFDFSLIEQILIQASLIWIVRSLYFHRSLFTALLDLGLVSLGLCAGYWAISNTGSPAVALWSFFLSQSLFCWIPDLAEQQQRSVDRVDPGQSSFQSSHRIAIDAVRKLTQQ